VAKELSNRCILLIVNLFNDLKMSIEQKYKFKILHTINHELFDRKLESQCTYEIEIVVYSNSRIEIKRKKFKVNDKKVTSKFENIAHTYNDVLFPVLFEIRGGNFFLANYNEISKRLIHTDKELKLKHEGAGLEYIRAAFFEKAAKDCCAMVNYMHSFGLISILRLCLEKPENNNDYHFSWHVLPLDTEVFWKGRKSFNPESNILQYKGESNKDKALFNVVKTAGNNYQYPDKVTDEESVITATIKHETQYKTTQFDFTISETEIKINNSYFKYRENLILTRKE